MTTQKKTNGSAVGRLTGLLSTIVARADVAKRAGITFGEKRDLYKELGYKRALDFNDYWERYQRGGIAARVVDAFPTATWRNSPLVMVKDNDGFNEAWNDLTKRLSVFHYLERVDRLAGIGRYATLFLGLRGGRAVDQAAQKVDGGDGLLFLSVFSEANAEIRALDGEPTSPRFGLPSEYNVQFVSSVTQDSRTFKKPVHASRIIHVADGILEDDVFGEPRMKKVWNYLDDLDKVVGGVSEAVWRTMDRGIQFDLDPELNLDSGDEEALEDEIEEYMHKLKRYILTKGVTANPLGSEVPDPSGPANTTIGLISGTTGVPQRILMGSERGQLASSQDERNFNSRVKERQTSYAEPIILRPFIDRLVTLGVLPAPGGEVMIEWPDLSTLTKREEADIAARFGQAIANVATQFKKGQAPDGVVVPPKLFATMFLNIPEDELEAALRGVEIPEDDEGEVSVPEVRE